MNNYKSDNALGIKIDPAKNLWVAVIQRAIFDWDKLEDSYDERAHLELLHFFFSDEGESAFEDRTLKLICEQYLEQEALIEGIRRRIRLSPLADNKNKGKSAIKALRRRCIACNQMKRLEQLAYYTTSFNTRRYAKYCLDCKAEAPTIRLMKVRRMETLLDNYQVHGSISAAIKECHIDAATFRRWKNKDPEFAELLKRRQIDLT